MLLRVKALARRLFPNLLVPPQGAAGVRLSGHREYVGGLWHEIGQLQMDMLLSRGLLPQHYLLDIACGSLRLGVKAIPYLEPGHYLGVEKEQSLIEAGINQELGVLLYREKKPELIVSDSFEFERLSRRPDYVIAQSLFTHLTARDISLCFAKLRPRMKSSSVFYATFFEAAGKTRNPQQSHARNYFAYTRGEMEQFGISNGFSATYIGDWNHPRNQKLVEYRPSLART